MKKILTAVSIATLLGAGSYAIAQDAGVTLDSDTGVSVETPSLDADADVGVDASVDASAGDMADNTYGAVMASISGSADVDLSAVTEDAQVSLVLISTLEGDAETEAAALDEALAADAEAQTALQANVEGNAAIKAKLEAEGYASSDVVAVKSNADGSVVVFVDDRA
ncbi:MAG: hypothetical protein KIT02_07875 [Devosia sp.]|uniref:hypothetical protein n=1 Tax=Devosia sp. TaxID=1871048 RepID=UPI0024C86D00|nr:hypothetical protein [Devosia sp.]UYO01106.1 MAG: hypothetical protein KIT02_07875 [Devosia sp.]